MRTIEQLLDDLKALRRREGAGENVARDRATVEAELASLGSGTLEHFQKNTRGGSRFAGQGADPSVVKHLAAGGGASAPLAEGSSTVRSARPCWGARSPVACPG